MAYHVFISYRRQGASELALLLYKQLLEDGYSPFLDINEMSSGHFDNQLYEHIAECSDMLVLLPPDAFAHGKGAEDWFYNEISYALRAGKNVIPVMLPGFQWPQTMLPFMDELRYCQGIEVSTQYFDAMYARLRELISYKPVQTVPARRKFPRSVLIIVVMAAVLAACAAWMLLGASRQQETAPPVETGFSFANPETAAPTQRTTAIPTTRVTAMPTTRPVARATPTPTPRIPGIPSNMTFTARASSYLVPKYNDYTTDPSKAVDGRSDTAWNENASGSGQGEWIELTPVDGRKYMYTGFEIANGFQNHTYKGGRWDKNGRVKALEVYADGVYAGRYMIEDKKYGQQRVYFNHPVECYKLRFTIADVYSGNQFSDCCISELKPF